jgi:hypothetical protein
VVPVTALSRSTAILRRIRGSQSIRARSTHAKAVDAGPWPNAEPLVDPLADPIAAIAAAPESGQPEQFLALAAVFPPTLAADPRFRGAVMAAHCALAAGRLAELLAR